ncbi:MAG: hypothetical protein ACRD10_13385 [Terriglobia bacterium]
MATKTRTPSVRILNHVLGETAQYCRQFLELRQKISRFKDGSDEYFDVMAEVAPSAAVVEAKMRSVIDEIDAITEEMPDD